MSQNVTGSFSRNTASNAYHGSSRTRNVPPDATDIGAFVERHRRLVELLFPFKVAWDVYLHVIRWENYLLTVSVALVLGVLMYYPSFFLSCLTLLAIIVMVVGKYYGQTKGLSVLKTRETPHIDELNQDLQALQRFHRDQKSSNSLLIEYKQIIQNIEGYFLVLSKFLDYVYRILLWKSLEVSLCVTILLCVCFVLLCTVHLRVIAFCLPVLILCSNRHFLKRTVELWKKGGYFIYKLVKLKPKNSSEAPVRQQPASEPSEPTGVDQSPVLSNGEYRVGEDHSLSISQSHENVVESLVSHSDSELVKTTCSPSTPTAREPSRPNVSTTNAVDDCAKCGASFTKLLKRRHICSYCGETFCGSCTTKVKRAFLGATAPAAYEESVRVCVNCKIKLDELKLSRPRTTSTKV